MELSNTSCGATQTLELSNTICGATQEFQHILQHPEVHCRVHKSPIMERVHRLVVNINNNNIIQIRLYAMHYDS
jgi:hypothetical protein